MPWTPTGSEDIVVRPVLGILFNLALGAMAGAWVPRFLRYERAGHAAVRWHWPAFVFPAVWACYRRLWVHGRDHGGAPVRSGGALARIDPALHDSPAAWVLLAVAVIWGVPGMLAALAADSLLYRRVKHEVREAEASSERTDVVAVAAADAPPHGTHQRAAARQRHPRLAGTGYRAGALRPSRTARRARERGRRARRGARRCSGRSRRSGRAAVRFRGDRITPQSRRTAARRSSKAVDLSPQTGACASRWGRRAARWRARRCCSRRRSTRERRIHWYCVAVDVPAQYLPQDCRAG